MLRFAFHLVLPLTLAATFILGNATSAVAGNSDTDTSPQAMPSVSVGYGLYPYQTLTNTSTGSRIGEMRVTAQQANLSYPIVTNGGWTRLDLSVSYQTLEFDYRDFTHPLESVHAVNATAFLRQKLSDTWGLMLAATPGYADDFSGPANLDATSSTVVVAGSHRFGNGVEAGLGVAIQNSFGESLPMPVASLDWPINDRLWFKSILPINAELTWLPIDALGLRAALQVTGSSYHGAEIVYRVNNPQLNYSAAAADLGARSFILPFVHVTVHAGYTFYRRFEFSEGRDPVPGGEYELKNGPVLGVDLGVGR